MNFNNPDQKIKIYTELAKRIQDVLQREYPEKTEILVLPSHQINLASMFTINHQNTFKVFINGKHTRWYKVPDHVVQQFAFTKQFN